MEENVKPLTAEELVERLQEAADFMAHVKPLDAGLLVVDGMLDLRALAAWINKRMGATEGSE